MPNGWVVPGTFGGAAQGPPAVSGRRPEQQPGVVTTPPPATSSAAVRVGTWVSFTMSGLTVVTFGLALTAAPDEVAYPFTSDAIADKWPADYLWMYPAMLLMLLFVVFVACVHENAPPSRKIFGLVALCLAVLAAAVLLINYFVQVTVMSPSLEKGQVDGFAMLTMYNPDGVFIALEELGFLLMSLSLAVLAPVFVSGTRVERAVRWLFVSALVIAVVALVAVSVDRGVDRGYVFELIVITIVWTTLIVGGPLVAVALRSSTRPVATRSR